MFLILCSSSDVPALWAYNNLTAMGLAPLSLLTTEMLSSAPSWEHYVESTGSRVSLKFGGGYGVSDHTLRGIINRLTGPPQQIVQQVAPADREYALQELNAFYLSWLSSLACPVLNPATPQGLPGRWLHGSEAVIMAHAAGLPAPVYRQSGDDPINAGYMPLAPAQATMKRVIVLEDEVFGDELPSGWRERCCAMATLCRTPLLGIDFYFAIREQQWLFSYASPLPDFRIGGLPFLKKLFFVLQKGTKQ
jgi:hypothetical protein